VTCTAVSIQAAIKCGSETLPDAQYEDFFAFFTKCRYLASWLLGNIRCTGTGISYHWFINFFSSDKCDVTLTPHHQNNAADITFTPTDLLKEIYHTCSSKGFIVDAASSKGDSDHAANLLRIGVASLLGGLLWGSSTTASHQICTFLLALRSILRWIFFRVVDPDPDWIRIQRLCGSGSVLGIRIQGQEN
jgi:hypothetical protein